jgi:hypothetical protein
LELSGAEPQIPRLAAALCVNICPIRMYLARVAVVVRELIPEIDEPRERHWLKMIESVSTECKLDRVVVLCGAAHLPTFSKKLVEAGHEVTPLDCRSADWYNPGYANSPSPHSI